MHFSQKMLKIETYVSPMKNPILGIEKPCLTPLFELISFLKKIDPKLGFLDLGFLC
eukprot:UN22504